MSTPLPTDDDLRERIRDTGLRATRARVAVLRVLHGLEGPTSHPELTDRLADDGWDRATLYRNLVDLAEVGLLRRIDLGDHLWRFELADAAAHDGSHPHFLCTACGDLSCLPDVHLDAAAGVPKAVAEGRVTVQLQGLCDRCDEADATPPEAAR